MTEASTEYYNLEQMGALMHMHPATVRRRVLAGDWPHSRPGGKILFSPKDREEIAEIVRRPAARPAAAGRRRRAS